MAQNTQEICPNRYLNGLCSFGRQVNFYSLDLHDPKATILPKEKEAVEDGWQTNILSEDGRIKMESIMDQLVEAHHNPREWLDLNKNLPPQPMPKAIDEDIGTDAEGLDDDELEELEEWCRRKEMVEVDPDEV
jgi:hypothetical protein